MKISTKVWLMLAALIVYLSIGGGISWILHGKGVPMIFIMALNYAICLAVFGPLLPFVFNESPK